MLCFRHQIFNNFSLNPNNSNTDIVSRRAKNALAVFASGSTRGEIAWEVAREAEIDVGFR